MWYSHAGQNQTLFTLVSSNFVLIVAQRRSGYHCKVLIQTKKVVCVSTRLNKQKNMICTLKSSSLSSLMVFLTVRFSPARIYYNTTFLFLGRFSKINNHFEAEEICKNQNDQQFPQTLRSYRNKRLNIALS